ncbi:MAG TPA: MarR family transcriptional regulator [Acetobacteraceae bacterium]|nr:MarR family transcriptional regulator [Acetobacteraceae bacterium]
MADTPVRAVPDTERDVALGELTSLIGYTLRRAQLAVFADFHHRFDADDIRPGQYSVLKVIALNPGLRQTRVSAALGIKRTNFVPLLDILAARGLAERRPVAGDRRSSALHLTPAGEALLERLDAKIAAHEAKFTERLGGIDGRYQLLGLLHRLLQGEPEPKAE